MLDRKSLWPGHVAAAQTPHQRLAVSRAEYVVVAGSHAYGTATPSSDVDIRGVFVAPVECYTGLDTIEQVEGPGQDTVFHEILKFIGLAAEANPNILELLFVDEEDVLHIGPLGRVLREHRKLFLSLRCLHSFSGYAFAQLKRIQGHYDWLSDPPAQPAEANYLVRRYRNRTSGKIIPETDYRAKMDRVEALKSAGGGAGAGFFESIEDWEPVDLVDKDSFDKAQRRWQQYCTWRENRNQARAGLEANHGYDTKHAAHLVRLLLQCRQVLEDGDLSTRLRGADLAMVQSIRRGERDYPSLLALAGEKDQLLREAAANSTLPRAVDRQLLNDMITGPLLERLWSERAGK
jgi:predicted nucleotidyltransferase